MAKNEIPKISDFPSLGLCYGFATLWPERRKMYGDRNSPGWFSLLLSWENPPGEFLSPYILRRSGHSGQCARRSEPRRIATWPDNAIFTLFWEGYFISWQTGLPVDIEMFYLYELLWCPSEDSLSVLLCNHSLDMEMCHPYELNLCVSEDCFSLFIFHSIDIVMFAFHCCL